jgi:hypothetical protein
MLQICEAQAFEFLPVSQFVPFFPLCHTEPAAAFFFLSEMFRFGFDIGVPVFAVPVRVVERLSVRYREAFSA